VGAGVGIGVGAVDRSAGAQKHQLDVMPATTHGSGPSAIALIPANNPIVAPITIKIRRANRTRRSRRVGERGSGGVVLGSERPAGTRRPEQRIRQGRTSIQR
jgi:hypothetical protein